MSEPLLEQLQFDAEVIAELHRPPAGGAPYAAGWGIDPVSGQHRHDGSAGTFYAYLVIDPGAQLVMAFAANTGPVQARQIAREAVAELLEKHAGN